MGFEGFLGEAYFWVKAVHIIFVIYWMAGLFMMPRYFAYHMETEPGSAEDAIWVDREGRLKRIILGPAMMIAWLMGLLLVLHVGLASGGWLHAKLLLVVLLTVFHVILIKTYKAIASGDRSRSSKFFRLINEVPALFIILIVIMAVIKPF